MALLWHEALKARNLFLCIQERAHFFFSPQPFWDCQSVLDWGWREPKISMEKEKRLETCCYRKQIMTLNASWASTLNCSCDSGVGTKGEWSKQLLWEEQQLQEGPRSAAGAVWASWQPPGSKPLHVDPPVDSLCDRRGGVRQWISTPSAQFYWEGQILFLRPSFNHIRGRTAALAKGDSATPKAPQELPLVFTTCCTYQFC